MMIDIRLDEMLAAHEADNHVAIQEPESDAAFRARILKSMQENDLQTSLTRTFELPTASGERLDEIGLRYELIRRV